MGATPPKAGGATATATIGKTFLQALANKPSPLYSSLPSNPEITPITSINGRPACLYDSDSVKVLAAHYQTALIGKFGRRKPLMEVIQAAFRNMGFKSGVQVGLIDFRHILIRFQDSEDYRNFRVKQYWTVAGAAMKILKWSPDFSPEQEPSVVPVWVTIRNVPLYYYNQKTIQDVAAQLGTFIKADAATTGVTRPSAIKMCVELDLLKERLSSIPIGTPQNHRECSIEYENLPSYCRHCSRLGHDVGCCHILHPEMKKIWKKKEQQQEKNPALSQNKGSNDQGSSGLSPSVKDMDNQEKSEALVVYQQHVALEEHQIIGTMGDACSEESYDDAPSEPEWKLDVYNNPQLVEPSSGQTTNSDLSDKSGNNDPSHADMNVNKAHVLPDNTQFNNMHEIDMCNSLTAIELNSLSDDKDYGNSVVHAEKSVGHARNSVVHAENSVVHVEKSGAKNRELEKHDMNPTDIPIPDYTTEPENTYEVITVKLSKEKFKRDMIRSQNRFNALIQNLNIHRR